MKRILALFLTLTMIMSFAVGAISGANEDAFADAVINEKTQFAYEKAAAEFAQGNDVEGLAAEENAEEILAKTTIPFRNFMGAVNSAHYVRANLVSCCGNPKPLPNGYILNVVPNSNPVQVIVHYQFATWDPATQTYKICSNSG